VFAFKVTVNNQSPVVGGTEDLGVLTAILTATGKLGSKSVPMRGDESRDFTFRLGGLTSRPKGEPNEHLVWLVADELKLGDVVTVEIVEAGSASPVINKEEEQHDYERDHFDRCKRVYLELRSKYEAES
jgi:hypothetical protein